MQDGHETRLDSDKRSSQGERSVFNVPEHSHRSERDRKIENLQKEVKKLQIEIKLRSRRRDPDGSFSDPDYSRQHG